LKAVPRDQRRDTKRERAGGLAMLDRVKLYRLAASAKLIVSTGSSIRISLNTQCFLNLV